MRSRQIAFALLAIALACRGAEPRAPTGGGRALAVDPASVPGRIALELWQLRDLTLGDWRAAHPDDAIVGDDSTSPASHLGSWCAEAVHTYDARGRAVERRAFFYPPAPPSILAPPDSAPDLVLACRLGLVWVSVGAADTAGLARLADSVRVRLDTVFGARAPGNISFFGSAFWSVTGRWSRDSVLAASALSEPPGGGATRQARVLAFAFLPVSGLTVDGDASARTGLYTPGDTLPLDSAAGLAGLDGALWAPLAGLVRSAAAARMPAPADSLVRPLARWLRAAEALPPERRAAALYAADRVLDRAMCSFRLCERHDSVALGPLEDLGAQFTYSPLGGAWVYERTWLAQARALDRDSPLGQRVFIEQLARALDFSGTCRRGAEGFRTVITNGELYLGRTPASPIAPDVHFLVGEAYRDIVALAAGAGDIYADSSRYSAEAAVAARRALEHYAAAIAAGAGGSTARAAWRRAWWLRAGLRPRDVRFLCIYD